MGYWNRGTRGGWGLGEVIAAAVRMGRDILPKTPWWSKKAEGMFSVFPSWRVMWLGSDRVRWSMQEACSGCWRGRKVEQEFKIVLTSKWGQFTFKMKNYPFLSWFSVKIINIYSFLWQNCQFIVNLRFENSKFYFIVISLSKSLFFVMNNLGKPSYW